MINEVFYSPKNIARNHQESSNFGFTDKKPKGEKVIHEKTHKKVGFTQINMLEAHMQRRINN